jgi:hypothetical protein
MRIQKTPGSQEDSTATHKIDMTVWTELIVPWVQKYPPKPMALASVVPITCGVEGTSSKRRVGRSCKFCARNLKSSKKSWASDVRWIRLLLGLSIFCSGPKGPRLPTSAGVIDRSSPKTFCQVFVDTRFRERGSPCKSSSCRCSLRSIKNLGCIVLCR